MLLLLARAGTGGAGDTHRSSNRCLLFTPTTCQASVMCVLLDCKLVSIAKPASATVVPEAQRD